MDTTTIEKSRILIADDEEVFRETTAAFLRKVGYECVCAPDAATALQLLRASPFDLLISDLEMPGNHDLEMIRELPKVAAGLPVILLTGHPTVQSAADSVRLPVVAYLVKPPKPEELEALVRQSIERHRTYRTVNASRQRVQDWARDLAQIEELLRHSPGPPSAEPVKDYLALTFQNLLLSLADLKQMIQSAAPPESKEETVSQVALLEALRQTIEVLAKTRQSFKSKALGDLRCHLEAVLRSQA